MKAAFVPAAAKLRVDARGTGMRPRTSYAAVLLIVACAQSAWAQTGAKSPSGESSPSLASPATPQPHDTYTFDFQDADIGMVLTALGKAGGVKLVYGDLPAKKMSLHVDQPVSAAEIPEIIHNVALTNGLEFSDDSGMIAIAPAGVHKVGNSLDAGLGSADATVHIYRLRHLDVTQVTPVLQSLFPNIPGPANNPFVVRRAMRNPQAAQVLGAATDAALATHASFVAEPTTNSLIVRAPPEAWEVVKRLVASIDMPPPQVVIEVMIAEVQRTDDLKYGVSGSVSGSNGSRTTTASGTLGPAPDSASNLILSLTHNGAVNVNAALAALRSRGQVKVLSLPLVFAQNNQESTLLVGSEEPFVESYTTSLVNTEAQNQVVQYRNVGTLLDIIPTINQDGYVNLQVYQEVSNVTNTVLFSAPVINTRQTQAQVFVKDGQTVVLGGLTERQKQDTKSGIPILSDIPLIGSLFATTEHTTTRTEIYLFLTPHVVSSDSDAAYIREQIRQHSALIRGIPADSLQVIDPPESAPAAASSKP